MRRIELSGPEANRGAACEVRYWRNAKAPGPGQSLWRANRDIDFCAAKARALVARLEAGGWTCSASGQAAPEPPLQATAADRDARAEPEPAAAPGQLSEARPAEPAQAALPAVAPSPAAAPTARSPLPAKPPPVVGARTEPSTSDELAAAPPASPKAALLDEVVEQTLHSVQELYGGEFEAELAAFGDLDGDGVDDAAVLITYQADRDEYVQYLVAYLFNGKTFQSVATRNVGGRFLDALRADLQGIADGRILVELEALDGGTTCCAKRRTAFALQNGQLVEVDGPGAASLEPASQAERASSG